MAVNYIYGSRDYNYNPDNDANNYIQVTYRRSGKNYTLIIEIPNYAISVFTLLEAIIDAEVLPDNKAFIGTSDPKGLYCECMVEYLGYENIRFYHDVDTLISVTVHSTGTGAIQYLYNHLGFTQKLSTKTGITLSTIYEGQYLKSPFTPSYLLHFNVTTGITRGNTEMISQVSSEYEIVESKIDGGTDITPLNIYNAYTYRLIGKKLNIINFPFSKIYALNNFLEFISEDETTVTINTTLKTMVFGSATGDTVKVDVNSSGNPTIKELQENLISFDIVLYHNTSFRGV